MAAKRKKIYNRLETLLSLFSNQYEIHAFGYGLIGWLIAGADPAIETPAKLVMLGVVAAVYGYEPCKDFLGIEISADSLPVDIRRQKHYFVAGIGLMVVIELALQNFVF